MNSDTTNSQHGFLNTVMMGNCHLGSESRKGVVWEFKKRSCASKKFKTMKKWEIVIAKLIDRILDHQTVNVVVFIGLLVWFVVSGQWLFVLFYIAVVWWIWR